MVYRYKKSMDILDAGPDESLTMECFMEVFFYFGGPD
jgi:hypothetical protein